MDATEDLPPERLWTLPTWLLSRAAWTGEQLVAEALSRSGLRRHHFAAMLALDEEAGISQAALGRRLDLDVSDVHAVVTELEERGSITRRRDPVDQRRNVLQLTGRGRRELATLERRVAKAQEELLAPLAPQARRNLVAALHTLVES